MAGRLQSHQQIAAALGISKGVVTKYVGLAVAAGLDWQDIAAMDEATLERRMRPGNLSITHNFLGDVQAEHDIGKACDPSPHDHVARWRIAFAREIATESGDAGQVVGHRFM